MSSAPSPGWYPDPQDGSRQRWWDGNGWTDHLDTETASPSPFGERPTGSATATTGDTGMASLAHVLAIPAAFFVLAFVGPLAIYLIRPNDPFVRAHAAAAVNFQLSMLLYLAVSGVVFVVLIVVTLGIAALLIPIYFVFVVVWLVLVLRAASKASRGETYRYPFTIRLVT